MRDGATGALLFDPIDSGILPGDGNGALPPTVLSAVSGSPIVVEFNAIPISASSRSSTLLPTSVLHPGMLRCQSFQRAQELRRSRRQQTPPANPIERSPVPTQTHPTPTPTDGLEYATGFTASYWMQCPLQQGAAPTPERAAADASATAPPPLATVSILGTAFSGNRAPSGRGASVSLALTPRFADDRRARLDVANSSFANETAAGDGGAIFGATLHRPL